MTESLVIRKPLVISTGFEGLQLQELITPADDEAVLEFAERNAADSQEIVCAYPSLETISAERQGTRYYRELRFGMEVSTVEHLLGMTTLTVYEPGDEDGNWLAIAVDREHRQRGIATAAGRAVIEYIGDNPGFNQLITTTAHIDNQACHALLKTLGFEEQPGKEIGGHVNHVVYKLHLTPQKEKTAEELAAEIREGDRYCEYGAI